MDCETGDILLIPGDKQRELLEEKRGRKLLPLARQQAADLELLSRRVRKNKMRNLPCPCGSEKKFKRCCLGRYL